MHDDVIRRFSGCMLTSYIYIRRSSGYIMRSSGYIMRLSKHLRGHVSTCVTK